MADDTRRGQGRSDACCPGPRIPYDFIPLPERLSLKELCPLAGLEKLGISYRPGQGKRPGVMEWLLIALTALIFLIDLSLPLGVAGGVPYVAVILTAFWSSRRSLPLLAAAGCTFLVVAGYFLSPAEGELWKVVANRSLAVFAIWTTAVLSYLRLHAMEMQRESESRIGSILETAPDGILTFDHQGIIRSFNPACERLFGYSQEEAIGKDLDFLLDPHAPDHPNFLWSLIEEETSFPARKSLELRGWRRCGDEFPLQVSIGEMRLGEQRAFTAVLRDVTRERTLDRLKSEFISTAAHEINTPLTSIMGYTELLLHNDFGEFTTDQRRSFLSEIITKCENLARIVGQLLDTSRIESGRSIPMEKAPCDLTRHIARVIDNFRLTSTGHRFDLTLPGTSPLLCLDSGKMEQVLENLLSNAVKYSPGGGRILVEVRTSETEYRFSVKDEGIGMNPEVQAIMFEKFYRADASNTSVSGLGLGLNIAKAIVDGHGGRIEVESDPGKGTTITVSLPVTSC